MKQTSSSKTGKRKERSLRAEFTLFIYIIFVKLSLYNLSVSAILTYGRRIVSMMTGNPNFPTPEPPLADVTVSLDGLQVAEEAMPGGPEATDLRNVRLEEVKQKLNDLRNYVEFIAKGNSTIILSSGMEYRSANTPVGILPAPEPVTGKNGVAVGSVKLKWKRVPKNTGYRVEATTNPSEGWPIVVEAEKASTTIYGLTPGTKYYFRIATLSHAGYEGYSATIPVRVNLPQD